VSRPLKLALWPLLLAQGLWTRRRTLRLPEAAGPREGRCGQGPPLRLLLLGDSSAAGVGVVHQRDALAAQLAEVLAQAAGRSVAWQLVARSGLSSAQAVALMRQATPQIADVAVVVLGVNDVVEQVSVMRALAARQALAEELLGRHGVRHVAFSSVPPMGDFPALPQPLRRVMGADAARHDRALQRWAEARAARRGDVSYLPLGLSLAPAHMAADGFHPGAAGYRVCAEVLGEELARRLALAPGL